jgi:hypothetical protein
MRKVLRALKWLGFVATLAALAVAITLAADFMRPIKKGNAEAFWSGVWGVPLPDGAERQAVRVYLTWTETYLYVSGSGIHLHGEPLAQVSQAEVLALFRAVLDRITARPPEELSVVQIEALLLHKVVDRNTGLEELARHRESIGTSPERLRAFLEASYVAQANHFSLELGTAWCAYEVLETQERGARLDRAQRYWLNIVFEAVFFFGIACLFWLPVMWGLVPLLLLVPYFLGYCRLAFTSVGPFYGGVLYPFVLSVYWLLRGFTCSLDIAFLNAAPQLLAWLTQPPGPIVSISGGSVGPTVPALLGVGLGLAVFGVQRFLQRRRTRMSNRGGQESFLGEPE